MDAMPESPLLAGRYALGPELGRGGMGQVVLARDTVLDRDVAIKTLHLDLAGDPSVAERFRQETMEVQFSIGQQALRVTISIGAATYSMRNGQQYPNKVAFLRAADQALYQAKQQGRNRTVAIKNGDQI